MVLYGRNVSYKRKLSTKVTTTATGMPQLTPPGYPGTRGTQVQVFPGTRVQVKQKVRYTLCTFGETIPAVV